LQSACCCFVPTFLTGRRNNLICCCSPFAIKSDTDHFFMEDQIYKKSEKKRSLLKQVRMQRWGHLLTMGPFFENARLAGPLAKVDCNKSMYVYRMRGWGTHWAKQWCNWWCRSDQFALYLMMSKWLFTTKQAIDIAEIECACDSLHRSPAALLAPVFST
jgi:hypothetical protein